ncbi:ABC transporter permease [Limnochorda pilosa]|uniref:Peptide ABC transporter n=1 Tax=Limnochorda pilosa TaxID=1555112 RepID=A0A0K2SM47_LIMPI|nr:ABC transporter permease [Limnochorda pilosa]BAS28188.1 peptide ABC transporter [Limnochorda pilosa]
MAEHLARQALALIVTLLLAVVAVFFAARQIPGDPADLIAGLDASAETVERLRATLGLDEPWPAQLRSYLGGLARGDLGFSLRQNRPVNEIASARLPVTLRLGGLAFLLAVVGGVGLGVVAGFRPGSGADRVVLGQTSIALALPEFWVGLLLILLFAVVLGWLPMLGYPDGEGAAARLRHLLLPAAALAIPRAAQIARLVRGRILDELPAGYVRTARAKGLRSTRFARHVLVNALPAVLPLIFLELGGLLSGTVVVEQVFGLPGLGQALLGAIHARDYALVQGISVLAVLVYGTASWAADLAQAMLDPRLRYA